MWTFIKRLSVRFVGLLISVIVVLPYIFGWDEISKEMSRYITIDNVWFTILFYGSILIISIAWTLVQCPEEYL